MTSNIGFIELPEEEYEEEYVSPSYIMPSLAALLLAVSIPLIFNPYGWKLQELNVTVPPGWTIAKEATVMVPTEANTLTLFKDGEVTSTKDDWSSPLAGTILEGLTIEEAFALLLNRVKGLESIVEGIAINFDERIGRVGEDNLDVRLSRIEGYLEYYHLRLEQLDGGS